MLSEVSMLVNDEAVLLGAAVSFGGVVLLGGIYTLNRAYNRLVSYTVVNSPRGDGDTIRVKRWLGKARSVRLRHIDAPESSQIGGKEAEATLKALMQVGDRVRLSQVETDKWGRLVAVITRGDGRVVNECMVKLGWAWWYSDYSDDARYGDWQKQAKQENLGLWRLGGAIEPKEYRNG